MLPKISPMELRLVRNACDDPNYVFELKHDGFRGIAYIAIRLDSGVSEKLANGPRWSPHTRPLFDR